MQDIRAVQLLMMLDKINHEDYKALDALVDKMLAEADLLRHALNDTYIHQTTGRHTTGQGKYDQFNHGFAKGYLMVQLS